MYNAAGEHRHGGPVLLNLTEEQVMAVLSMDKVKLILVGHGICVHAPKLRHLWWLPRQITQMAEWPVLLLQASHRHKPADKPTTTRQ